MVSLPELLISCSTLFLQANNTITGNVQDVATVLSNQPWENLGVIKTPDCGVVFIDDSWLQPMMLPMVRSRMKASLVVSTKTNEQTLYIALRSKTRPKLNFPVYITRGNNS